MFWTLPAADAIRQLDTRREGLTSAEAAERLSRYGPNTPREHRRASMLRMLAAQFASPLVLILVFAVVVSALAGAWVDATVVLAIVAGSGILGFAQEHMASSAVERLRQRITAKTQVLRDGQAAAIPIPEVVPGDIVSLSAGSLIPADCLLLDARDFFVSQSVLTGETFPVEKKPGVAAADAGIAERPNCVFLGSSVRSGMATALVVRTGAGTAFGEIAARLETRPPMTEFERGLHHFGIMLMQVLVALVLLVFAANVLYAKPAIDSLLFAVALAVGLTPQLLPAIFTITLSKGAQRMAAGGVIVRRLNAIENLGSMDVLCTDKTGTLTEGVIRLDGAFDAEGKASPDVLRYAVLNATFETGLGNPLDDAIRAQGETSNIEGYRKFDEIPYDFIRKRLSVAVIAPEGPPELITKGALEAVLDICASVREGALDEARRQGILARYEDWGRQGFRVLGVASRRLPSAAPLSHDDEREMTFEGFLIFFDPPKQAMRETLADLRHLGVDLKIVTGDSRGVALHIAETVGLDSGGVLTGHELRQMGDEALWHAAEKTTLFVQVDPNQKERIIRALQKTGHVVGYMGDGINDAPALHAADVGISVDQAVDVAKEAADLVLLEHDLAVLHSGIEQGRRTFANTLKYIFTSTSANFGNMLSMAGASLFLPFLPLLAKQILLNNFLADIPAMSIAGDNVDRNWVERPPRWDIHFIRRFMIRFGLMSSVFDYATFGMLLFIAHATPEVFRTAWFVESLLTELVIALVVRTRVPFYRSRPGSALLVSTIAVTAVALSIPYLPDASVFGFVRLPAEVMALILAITSAYVVAVEALKRSFYRASS
ncbi:MAG: magnesium-translocating P-type ATPase [Bryobacteraceae bacterium]